MAYRGTSVRGEVGVGGSLGHPITYLRKLVYSQNCSSCSCGGPVLLEGAQVAVPGRHIHTPVPRRPSVQGLSWGLGKEPSS